MTPQERKVFELALAALERCGSENYTIEREAITAIKEALAQPEQEPVAWRGYNWGHSPDDWVYRDFDDPILDGNGNNVGQPLYTTPPQRKPLTDDEIAELWLDIYGSTPPSGIHEDGLLPWRLARAIEAAHGIKE